jgi:hypothetical protein
MRREEVISATANHVTLAKSTVKSVVSKVRNNNADSEGN